MNLSIVRLNDLINRSTIINGRMDKAVTSAEVVELSNLYLKLIKETDLFFSETLKKLEENVINQGKMKIYENDTVTELTTLSQKLSTARQKWDNGRYLFTVSEDLISKSVLTLK